MKDTLFPVTFKFRITTLSNDFTAKDAEGRVIAYVKQKMFKLKEAISIYDDESKSNVLYTIKANKWLDFSAAYSFFDSQGIELGKIARKGWRSIWKSEYELIDQHEHIQYHIREENGWIKVMDSLFSELPIIGILTGYVFNPTYVVLNQKEEIVIRLKKKPSFLGREFELNKLGATHEDDNVRIMLGLMMMILLERHRG